jgi:VWFA-related protein
MVNATRFTALCLGIGLLAQAEVRFNVVVRNNKGEPVDSLKKEDFTIYDRGQRQEITGFSMEAAGVSDDNAQRSRALPPNTFTNRTEILPNPPETVTAVLFDELNTKFEDQVEARRLLLRYLGGLLPQDRVALYVLGRDLRVLHDFTADASSLLSVLGRYQGRINTASSGSKPDGSELDRWVREGDQKATSAKPSARTTLAAVAAIADHVTRVPGRKNLVWISGAFSAIGMGPAARALQDSGVAVYPVAAADSAPHEAMRELALRTGSKAYFKVTDIKDALRTAIDDARVSYVLTFPPARASGNGAFHEMTVQVNRPGAIVIQPSGYYSFSPAPGTEAATKAEFQQALWSPIESAALGMTVRLAPKQGKLRVVVLLDVRNIQLKREDDRRTGKVEVLFAQQATEDRVATLVGDSIDINLTPEAYADALKQGLIWSKELELADARYQLKVAARDTSSGRVGVVIVPMKGLR